MERANSPPKLSENTAESVSQKLLSNDQTTILENGETATSSPKKSPLKLLPKNNLPTILTFNNLTSYLTSFQTKNPPKLLSNDQTAVLKNGETTSKEKSPPKLLPNDQVAVLKNSKATPPKLIVEDEVCHVQSSGIMGIVFTDRTTPSISKESGK